MGWDANPTTSLKMDPALRLAIEQMSGDTQRTMSDLLRFFVKHGMRQVHRLAEREGVDLRIALRHWSHRE
jgi:hypothetical protein